MWPPTTTLWESSLLCSLFVSARYRLQKGVVPRGHLGEQKCIIPYNGIITYPIMHHTLNVSYPTRTFPLEFVPISSLTSLMAYIWSFGIRYGTDTSLPPYRPVRRVGMPAISSCWVLGAWAGGRARAARGSASRRHRLERGRFRFRKYKAPEKQRRKALLAWGWESLRPCQIHSRRGRHFRYRRRSSSRGKTCS
eukprot:SAG31_NODE_2928_length_4900_cov_6.506561_4_plen_194_part_00